MCSKRVISEEVFLEIFNLYDEGYGSMKQCINALGYSFDRSYIFNKYHVFKNYGKEALRPQKEHGRYSVTLKLRVVRDYLNGEGSLRDLAIKYQIKSFDTIRTWINKYTNGEELTSYNPKPEVYKMKNNKITYEDRVKITQECIAKGLNYKEIADKYQINYNQIYRWVKKYQKHGEAGLIDGRGKGKPVQAMTQEEELKAQLKALQERNKYLEMENDVLKKQEEIERMLIIQELDKKHRT